MSYGSVTSFIYCLFNKEIGECYKDAFIEWPNADLKDTSPSRTVLTPNIIWGDAIQVSFGCPDSNAIEDSGVFNILIKTSLEEGEKEGLEIAQKIRNIYKNKLVADPKITFAVPNLTKLGRVDNKWQFALNCPFRYTSYE